MSNSIFSTYSTTENQVTSTILAVFERLNSNTVTNILQIIMEDSTLELIKYDNQIKNPNSQSVPDGRIKGLFDFFIETKITEKSINIQQIEKHCKYNLKYDFSKLLVLTPDFSYPDDLKKISTKNSKIIWANFDKIIEAIDSVLQETVLLLDREKFLLIELKDFIINQGLTSEDFTNTVLIIPAGFAWSFYEKYSIYRCQANRTFRNASYLGFYADGEIKKYFPQILGYVNSLNIIDDDFELIKIFPVKTDEKSIKNSLKKLKNKICEENQTNITDDWKNNYKYLILTEKQNGKTFKIDKPIKNNKTSYSDKKTAFVQKQTYLNIEQLKGKKFTSELEKYNQL